MRPNNAFRMFVLTTLLISGLACSSGGGGGSPSAPVAVRVNGDTPATHSDPVVAFNASGTIGIAVWLEYASSSDYRILYSTYSGGAWQPESALITSGVSVADIASDGSGFMTVYCKNSNVYSILFDSSGVPGAPVLIQSGTSYTKPHVVSGGPGQYGATWSAFESGTGRYRAFATNYSASAWGTVVPISNTSGDVYDPSRIASKGGGEYGVTWRQYDSSTYNIYANLSSSGAWTASTASLVENGTGNADLQQIASDGISYAVAWQQFDGANWSIFANISSADTWSANAAVPVENVNSYADSPLIASNGVNYAVVWAQNDASNSIYVNSSSGGAWDAGAATVVENSNQYAFSPSIAVSGQKYAVAWDQTDSTTGGYSIHANIFSTATSTVGDAATAIDDGATSAWIPMIAKKGSGFGVVWYQDNASGGNSIYAALNSGTWGAAENIVKAAYRGTSSKPVMATNQNGVTLAVWTQSEGYNKYTYGNLYSNGTWSASFKISSGPVSNTVDAGTNGTDFMIAYERGGLKARTCDSAGTLGPEYSLLDPLNSSFSAYPKIASNGSGYAVVWTQSYNNYTSVYANIYTGPSTTWSGATLLENLDTYAYGPFAIASNGQDYTVVWSQWDAGGSSQNIYASMSSGASWGNATALDNSTNAQTPRISSNGSGYAVVWQQVDIYANIFSSLTGTTKDGAVLIGLGSAKNPAIASDGIGYAAMWEQWDGAVFQVYTNIFSSLTASTKDTAAQVSTGSFEATATAIASDGNGYGIVWQQSDGTASSIYGSTASGTMWSGPILRTKMSRQISRF